MSLAVDRIDLMHGTPQSRFEMLASAVGADIGFSDGEDTLKPDRVYVYTDFFRSGVHDIEGLDYGFVLTNAIKEGVNYIELQKRFGYQLIYNLGAVPLFNAVSVLRGGRYGDENVVVVTQTVRASDPSRFNVEVFDVRPYNALFETAIIDAVRSQAITA